MRVLLILPASEYKRRYPTLLASADFPTGFAYLASALRAAGHEVFGLNPNNDASHGSARDMVRALIARSLRAHEPELIGVGGLATDYAFLSDAIRIIRQQNAGVPVVCGGRIVTHDAEFILSTLRPDYCVLDEGESTLVRLANTLERGERDLEGIPNLGYWRKGVPRLTSRLAVEVELDQLAFPDFEPFGIREMLDEYSRAANLYLFRYARLDPRPMPIVGSRGCLFCCTFCIHGGHRRYRTRSIQNILEEIRTLYDAYHFNILVFQDELFAAGKERVREFSRALIQARATEGWDFDWMFQCHPSVSLDRETLALAREAGCWHFSFGVESVSPKVLASMKKKLQPAKVVEAVQLADAVGIGFGASFAFGDIAETAETIRETMEFIARHCLDVHTVLGTAAPYPGSALFEHCLRNGIIRDKGQFYEQVDEDVLNMTQLPDRLWVPWAYLLGYLAKLARFTKATDATSCVREERAPGSLMAAQEGKAIYRVSARCPHCGRAIEYRELLEDVAGRPRRSGPPRAALRRLLGLPGRQQYYRLSHVLLKGAAYFGLGFRNPLFRTLAPLIGEADPVPSFTTGCPRCHKRIRVRVPLGTGAGGSGLIQTLLRIALRQRGRLRVEEDRSPSRDTPRS